MPSRRHSRHDVSVSKRDVSVFYLSFRPAAPRPARARLIHLADLRRLLRGEIAIHRLGGGERVVGGQLRGSQHARRVVSAVLADAALSPSFPRRLDLRLRQLRHPHRAHRLHHPLVKLRLVHVAVLVQRAALLQRPERAPVPRPEHRAQDAQPEHQPAAGRHGHGHGHGGGLHADARLALAILGFRSLLRVRGGISGGARAHGVPRTRAPRDRRAPEDGRRAERGQRRARHRVLCPHRARADVCRANASSSPSKNASNATFPRRLKHKKVQRSRITFSYKK